ncbi:unnamed protein product [Cylicocyclus nassatus]|uniref:Uncharacterized protein n=1 Tax=Cylicocyclus nassatus TaxID=53992 RepID=A0AA36GUR8_CYLNA|nr:unnamed protein product [Cylicocyclus nassatus]CAJ0598674.1 unnamed protein product [Cylicocyclus nassatus]CAJ0598675.1 unnamed protein product [Cylicocyclus nassatus]CAJ0598676.1 unnamed protein product [Cylicocyclus nassatus]
MTTTVRAYKGLMTKRSQVALAWLEESTQRLQHLKEESTQQEQVKEFTMTVARCDEYLELLEASLTKLTEAFDKLQDTTGEEEDQLDKHAEIAQETIMKNEGKTIHKAWREFLNFKEDVKRQQQEILDSIQKMSQYFETFKAWGMKNGTDAIQQEIQEEDQKAQRRTALAKHSSKLAMKEKAEVQRRYRTQSSSEKRRRNIQPAPTLSQKQEESKRSNAKCKRKHTLKGSFSYDEEGKQKNIAQRQRQMRKIEQNLDHFSCTGRRSDVNVNCHGTRKQHIDACLNLRSDTRRIDVQHGSKLCRCVAVRHTEDHTEEASCFYRRNTKSDAVILNHHAICGLLEEIAHKQRKLMRQAKKVKDNMKIISKRTLLWDEKKGVAWSAKKGRLKANSAFQTQSI